MNFASHAAVARLYGGDDEFVIGSVLPDIAAILGLRLRRPNETFEPGIRHHYAADSAFHAGAWFTAQMTACSQRLQAAGVERGPARAAAHVGVELLLDGAVLDDDSDFDQIWQRLSAPDAALHRVVDDGSQFDWADRLAQFTSRLDPWRYADPQYSARRIVGMLEHRPRLRLAPGQESVVSDVLTTMSADIRAAAPSVLRDVAAAVTQAGIDAERLDV